MKFLKFPSFVNHTDKIASSLGGLVPKDMKWYCSEKIDGSNMSLIIDTTTREIATGRRQAILAPTEKFFGGWQRIAEDNKPGLLQLCDEICAKYPETKQIHVFGEYFGDGVLKRVFYTTEKTFRAFDVALYMADNSVKWLGVQEWTRMLDGAKIPRIPFCKEGTFEECLAFDTYLDSTIPDLLGETCTKKNICEGYVLRSEETLFVSTKLGVLSGVDQSGDETGWTRTMIKKKNAEFNETVPVVAEKTKTWSSEKLGDVYVVMLTYINDSRAVSVRSKMTDTEAADRRKYAEGLLADAVKDAADVWNPLTPGEKSELTKALMGPAFKVCLRKG